MEQRAKLRHSSIELAYVEQGNPSHPTVLLVMGLGAQWVHWPDAFVDALLTRNLRVIRFDNRDAGRSSYMLGGPTPDFAAAMRGDFTSAPYTLSDMAADTVGLLDFLGISAAHLVGASMGGGIAQMVAVEYPQRVLSLTSMMFTTGNPSVGQPLPQAQKALGEGPPVRNRNDFVERAVRLSLALAPSGSTPDVAAVARTAGTAFDRGHDEQAYVRQAVATLASGDRTEALKAVRVPALVVHGRDDSLCDPSGGEATADAIPGARLVLFERMGHGLPPEHIDRLADLVADVVAQGEAKKVALE